MAYRQERNREKLEDYLERTAPKGELESEVAGPDPRETKVIRNITGVSLTGFATIGTMQT